LDLQLGRFDEVRSFAQEIALLPESNFSVLELDVRMGPVTHEFGPLVLHLLKIRPVIRRFKSLFGWLVADGWCWFVLKEEYCWLIWWLVYSERKVLLAGG
jgi:hypothetical protein